MKPYQIYWKNAKYDDHFIGSFSTESARNDDKIYQIFMKLYSTMDSSSQSCRPLLFIGSAPDFIENYGSSKPTQRINSVDLIQIH